ncbi:MAG: hypothetical protein GEV11_18520 [Streptosporangiales bacterium]|nr:hypothetical protein [Streptosporangiales bacterium]
MDRLGRFVCRRDAADPQRWEYRRELVMGDRAAVTARLAPDGWEPCGAWVMYQWYKRPLAASIGPAAAIPAPPPAPGRSSFFSRRFYLMLGAVPVVLEIVALVAYVNSGDAAESAGVVVGGLVGAAAGGLAVFAYGAWQNRSR